MLFAATRSSVVGVLASKIVPSCLPTAPLLPWRSLNDCPVTNKPEQLVPDVRPQRRNVVLLVEIIVYREKLCPRRRTLCTHRCPPVSLADVAASSRSPASLDFPLKLATRILTNFQPISFSSEYSRISNDRRKETGAIATISVKSTRGN